MPSTIVKVEMISSCDQCFKTRKDNETLLQQLANAEDAYECFYDWAQKENAEKDMHLAQMTKAVTSLQRRLKTLRIAQSSKETAVSSNNLHRSPRALVHRQVQTSHVRGENSNDLSDVLAARKTVDTLSSQVSVLEKTVFEQKEKLVHMHDDVARLENDVETWKRVARSAERAAMASKTELQLLEMKVQSDNIEDHARREKIVISSVSIGVQADDELHSAPIDKEIQASVQTADVLLQADLPSHRHAILTSLCTELNTVTKQLIEESRGLKTMYSLSSDAQTSRHKPGVHERAVSMEAAKEDDAETMRQHINKLAEQLTGLVHVNK
jgi:hypothetical protein